MTSQIDHQAALEQARSDGAAEMVRQLREFTGIEGYEPDLRKPEHLAYLAYERELAHGIDTWSNTRDGRQAKVDALIAECTEARHVMEAEQKRRQAERSDKAGARFIGVIQDVTFPEKRNHAALQRALERAWKDRHKAEARVMQIRAELGKVSTWLNEMFVAVDAARESRP